MVIKRKHQILENRKLSKKKAKWGKEEPNSQKVKGFHA